MPSVLANCIESARQSTNAALIVLAGPRGEHPTHSPEVLRKDALSLLALIRVDTTKLALSFSSSSPSQSAAVTPLADLANHVSALALCTALYHPMHGSTLLREVTCFTKDIVNAVASLLTLLHDIAADPGVRHQSDETFLKASVIHDIIDRASASDGLSVDNVTAIRKKWDQDHSSLNDSLAELEKMAENLPSTNENGWDELGIQSHRIMTAEEVDRTRKVHAILRLSTLLHQRIVKYVFSSALSCPISPPTIQNLDSFSPLSPALLAASDDLVSTLYPPQEPADIIEELNSFTGLINRIRSILFAHLQDLRLSEQPEKPSVQSQSQSASTKDPVQWFTACMDLIDKAILSLQETLNET